VIETMRDPLPVPPAGSPAAQSNPENAGQVARRAPIENSLLAAVPRKEYRRLLAGLEPVTLSFGDVLYEPGETIQHVYFPGASLVSLLTLADGHLAMEVGLIGREGMVGLPLVLGHHVSPVRALVQGSGTAMRMAAAHFRKEFQISQPLQHELYYYTHTLMAQISQTAACNRFHVVEKRLARWLLMTHDRVKSDQFHMTHEFLGHMLGVRRVGVTKAAQSLQKHRLIHYSRGEITVLDRTGLEAASCECYEAIKDMHDSAQTGPEMHNMRISAAARTFHTNAPTQAAPAYAGHERRGMPGSETKNSVADADEEQKDGEKHK
jgi:CRP-like cAMP-binding protein